MSIQSLFKSVADKEPPLQSLSERDFPSLSGGPMTPAAQSRSASIFGSIGGGNMRILGSQAHAAAASSMATTLLKGSQLPLPPQGIGSTFLLDVGNHNAISAAPGSMLGIPQASAVALPSQQHQEFQINTEDFPALGGAAGNGTIGASAASAVSGSAGLSSALVGVPNSSLSAAVGGAVAASSSVGGGGSSTSQSAVGEKRGIVCSRDGQVSGIPHGMLRDQYGMVGLLCMLRAIETDPHLVTLALGHEMTSLGVNLNPPRNVCKSFGGPWAEMTRTPHHLDWPVPQEYLVNHVIRDKLAPIKLNRYQDDLLFFVFYMCPGELFQLAAAAELYHREWRFHKEERVWIAKPPGMQSLEKTAQYERGTYYIFDPAQWRKITRPMLLEYEKLDERPPMDMQQQQQSAQQTQLSSQLH